MVSVIECGGIGSFGIADALADHERADQAGDAGVDVHHGAAGEVDRAEGEDQAGRIAHRRSGTAPEPDHVGDREVDEGDPERDEEEHGGEFDPLGEGADDQRRRDAGEGHLEDDEGELGDDDAGGECLDHGAGRHAGEERLREAADEAVPASRRR